MNPLLRKSKLLALLAGTILLAGVGATTLLAEEGEGPDTIRSEEAESVEQIDYSQFQVAPEKRLINPDAGLTDEQRRQKVEDARARQRNFATGFIPNGGDPRALKRFSIDPYSAGHTSLELSVERAHLIVVGRVAAVEYRADDSNDGAHSRAKDAVSEVIRGPAGLTSVEVRQFGSQMITNEGPALVQQSTGELLLPGDEVLLMLIEVEGMNLALDGTGIIFFDGGIARPMAASLIKDQLTGLPRSTVIERIEVLVAP